MAKKILQTPPANIVGRPNVQFTLEAFEALIQNQGYNVQWEETIMCPCRGENTSPLLTCKNCLGTGWVMLGLRQTKMIIMSINNTTKYTVWSPERKGTVQVTAFNRDKLSYMDRITIIDSDTIDSEILYLSAKDLESKRYAYTVYKMNSIINIFGFASVTSPLVPLILDEDYEFNGYTFTLIDNLKTKNMTIVSIRYRHYPQYFIIDIPHDIRASNIRDDNSTERKIYLPINAIAAKASYVIDRPSLIGQNIDNTQW
jgi:hypothetical protein